jgi:exosortase
LTAPHHPKPFSPALLAIIALWLHFFWCLVPAWSNGEYYSYGFFVPPLFFMLGWRRNASPVSSDPWQPGRGVGGLLVAVGVISLLALIPLRVIQTGDPGWRPPFVLHGVLVTVASHLLLATERGWKGSAWFLPITLLAWSAVPYIGRIEQGLVRSLTGMVIGLTREIFILGGYPVEQLGERLALGDQVVEVTGGCSGIRSVQSLVMTALFFGELLWLRWPQRFLLLAGALASALICNTARAFYLSWVQFFQGGDAAAAAHDPAGHLAFAAAALLLYLFAFLLAPGSSRRPKVRRVQVSTVQAPSDKSA